MSLLLALALDSAHACSIAAPPTLQIDPRIEDEVPPAPPVVLGVEIRRGRGPRGGMVTSCDDIGAIEIEVARPEGDPDDPEEVGYRLKLLAGKLPEGLALPGEDALLGAFLRLHWLDGATDHQEAFSFTLALVPVDRAGNEGKPARVTIEDEGSTESEQPACATAPGQGVLWAAVLLGLLARRRQRPR